MAANLFVTGTDTNVGKTVLSALLVVALKGTYWKPIQTGSTEGTDRQQILRWTELPESRAIAECYCFEPPVSPHLAAEKAGVTIELDRIRQPHVPAPPLIIEGAGGVMVPINASETMLDLMISLGVPIVVASRTALGTINHSVLTVRALRAAGLCVKGVVMIGPENKDNERAVEKYGPAPIIGRIPQLERIDRDSLLRVFDTQFDRSVFS